MEAESRLVVAGGGGWEKWGIIINGYEDIFGGMKMFWNWVVVMVVQFLGM